MEIKNNNLENPARLHTVTPAKGYKKFRVAVLMGGKSIEREVSFNSGRTVCDHLDTARYEVIPIFQDADGALYLLPWHFLHRGKITDFAHRLPSEARRIAWDNLKELADFVYIAVHGRYAEDGTLQGFLEILGIPYLGSKVLTSALCMDKIAQKTVMRKHGFDVAKDITLAPHEICSWNADEILQRMHEADFDFPCIVKPSLEGSSLGISVAFTQEELRAAAEHACFVTPGKEQAVLVEEKLEGMEFSCIVIEDYKTNTLLPLPPTEIVPENGTHFFDYEQKYMPGRATKFTPPRAPERIIKAIQETCSKLTTALEIKTISRLDGFVTRDERIVIVDPNTLSGMGPASFLFREAAEINMGHTELINHLIETELHHYGLLDAIEKSYAKAETSMQKKLRVAVLMGGASHEKEISLESGRNICYKLSPHTYEIIPIFLTDKMELYPIDQSILVRNSTKEIQSILDESKKIMWDSIPSICDFVFIGLHGGHGENGGVQGTLEMLGLPYNGSGVLASALCMNKYKTNEFLASLGFQVPQHLLIARADWQQCQEKVMANIVATLPMPVVIKPHDDGCSVMVQKASMREEIISCVNTLFADGKEFAFIEECISGMELTVGVFGNEHPRALPPSQAVANHGILSIAEKFLPGAGENQTPAPLPDCTLQLVQNTMVQVYNALNCKGYARIDCFYQPATTSPTGAERIVILEINTLPGMTPATVIFHQAAEIGMRPMEFIDEIVKLGIELHGHKEFTATRDAVPAHPEAPTHQSFIETN
jgi:D-alanine--D-alanine ligase